MAVEIAPATTLTPAALDDRRLAVESTIGTRRIENMEPDETTMQILNRYAQGQIDLEEASRLIHQYSANYPLSQKRRICCAHSFPG
jgi:hypothetical protein